MSNQESSDLLSRLGASDAAIKRFCRRHHIREFSLFGSAARGELKRDSDVDVIVDFKPGANHSLFDLVAMEEELERIFGREVDLLTRRSLDRMENRFRKDGIVAGVRKIYAA